MIYFQRMILLAIFCILFSGCSRLENVFNARAFSGVGSQAQDWDIILDKLRVTDPQEDRSIIGVPLSDGDEPYIIMIGFRSRFGQAQSTQTQLNNYENDTWARNSRSNMEKQIPVSMGQLRFTDVARDEIIGAVIIAMESDRTPWAIIRNRVETIEDAVRAKVAESIEDRGEPRGTSLEFIEDVHQAVLEPLDLLTNAITTGQAIENIVFSGVDMDEYVGANSILFLRNIDNDDVTFPRYREPTLTDALTQRVYSIGGNGLVFRNSSRGAVYHVEFRVEPIR